MTGEAKEPDVDQRKKDCTQAQAFIPGNTLLKITAADYL